ncbi:MAG: glucose-6-phosphate isomerase [Deltaproteobacteria bacterium]|jgi:glucose-6-phosphate isomerase|nr:glucose-6-phosphate isomerase [Deltaproteobacteria bacterium]
MAADKKTDKTAIKKKADNKADKAAEKKKADKKAVSPKSQLAFTRLDFNNLSQEVVGEAGLSPEDLADLREPLTSALQDVWDRHQKGQLDFLSLPGDRALAKEINKLAKNSRQRFQDVVVLGIGGSALGASAIFTALRPLNHNRLPDKKRGWPRLTVADNVDPEGFEALLDTLDPATTLFNVISKSGATAETMSQFMIAFDWLRRRLGKSALAERLLVTTDPEGGVLRKIVNDLGLQSLPIPPGVGGRFSVLTAVGLAPLALVGVDIDGLLAGAQAAVAAGRAGAASNQAAMLAGLNWLMTTRKNRGSVVLIPYADALSRVADWFNQLWNESLGKGTKLDGTPNVVAQTALKAVGATDQHSQLQMWMEGPQDKTIMFLGVDKLRTDCKIPAIFQEHEALAYLGGQTLGTLLNNELKGTARALAESGRPNLTVSLPAITPQTVGSLVQTLELATVISGILYGVDPLDQPGVELGKKFTYGLMGRQGFEDFLTRYNQGALAKKKYILS